MALTTERLPGVTVIRLSRDVIYGEVAPLAEALDACVADKRNVLIDMECVRHVSAMGVDVVQQRMDALRKQGQDLKLVHACAHVQAILDATGVADFVHVCEGRDDALASFGKGVGLVERDLLCRRAADDD